MFPGFVLVEGRTRRLAAVAVLGVAFLMMTAGFAGAAEEGAKGWRSKPGTYAVFKTSEGTIVAVLYPDEAPATVENFVGLAEGTKEFTDPTVDVRAKRPYYDGTKFHRIIPNFMMQGGDPTGTGRGGPGYTIPDEFASQKRKFDGPGRLAMARTASPNSGGSQFFITHAPYPSLNNKYTIFGQVVEGQKVVNRVCAEIGTPKGTPKKDVILEKVTIERVGEKTQTRPRTKKS